MRDLEINKQYIYFDYLIDGETTEDEYGNIVPKRSEKVLYKISISSGTSNSYCDIFGKNISYDRVMTTSDMNCKIDEYSNIWYNSQNEKHNYEVVSKNNSLNNIRYAIKMVK